MYALCVSGAVNMQGFVWKVLIFLILRAIYNHSFIHLYIVYEYSSTESHNMSAKKAGKRYINNGKT